MLAREHCCCRKESRRYYRNEFGHSGNLDISAAIIVQNAWQVQGGSRDSTKWLAASPWGYGHKWDVLRSLFGNV